MNIHRVVIGDHDALCRAGLTSLLRNGFAINEVVEASDFPHTLRALSRSPRTTMVTVNINLQAMSGITGLSQLRADHPFVLLVVVAECRERDVVLASLRAGVHGFIPTSTPPDEMVRAFEAILSGNIYVPPLVSECTVTTSDGAMDTPIRRAVLTDRQFEVLKLVAVGQSDKEIARSLSISGTTVKVHMRALFRALGVHNRVSAAAMLPTLLA